MTFQNDLNILFKAIKEKRTIVFTYKDDPKDDPVPRKVEPYAVFSRTSNNDGMKYILDGRQWCGYSSSSTSQWKYRQFTVTKINPGIQLGDTIKDSNAPYDPDSPLYANALVKREG